MASRILSPSAINLYFQCPRRFYYRYIKKLPVKDSIYALRGSIVHEVLEKIYDINSSELTNVNYKKIIQQKISELFKSEWENSKTKLNNLKLGKDMLDFFYEDSTVQLDMWTSKFLAQLEKKLTEVFMIKKAWDYYFPKERELKLISNSLGMIGYVDQVLELGDRMLIIDYKTSKSPKLSPEYNLQLAAYFLMYKEKYNIEPETYLWFLKFGLKRIAITPELITDTRFKIEQVHEALKSESILDYPRNETGLCKWCNANGSGQCDFYDECFSQTQLL